MDLGPLTETIEIGDELRRNALDRLGLWAPTVTIIGQAITTALALAAIGFGWSLWAPPSKLRDFPVRMGGLVIGFGMLVLWALSLKGVAPSVFLMIGFVAMLFGVFAALVYYRMYSEFTFKCPDRKTVYVKGRELTDNAKLALAGQGKGPLAFPNGSVPTSAVQFFCGTNTVAETVWTPSSVASVENGLIRRYLAFIVPTLVALASVAWALAQPDYEIDDATGTFLLPGEVLFDFKKAEIRPGAEITLRAAAQEIRKRQPKSVHIVGYADSLGTPTANEKWALLRAEAVHAWLADPKKGALIQVQFRVEGRGAAEPVAPNKKPDLSDNPVGRAQNRRVTITIEK